MTPPIEEVHLVQDGLVIGILPYSLFVGDPDFPQNTPEIEFNGVRYRVLGINLTTVNTPHILAVNVETDQAVVEQQQAP